MRKDPFGTTLSQPNTVTSPIFLILILEEELAENALFGGKT